GAGRGRAACHGSDLGFLGRAAACDRATWGFARCAGRADTQCYNRHYAGHAAVTCCHYAASVIEPTPRSKGDHHVANILVVDDDRDFRAYVATVLERKGHEVTTAGSGSLVVRAIRDKRLRGHFDVAVVDILMPDVSGIEVIR